MGYVSVVMWSPHRKMLWTSAIAVVRIPGTSSVSPAYDSFTRVVRFLPVFGLSMIHGNLFSIHLGDT